MEFPDVWFKEIIISCGIISLIRIVNVFRINTSVLSESETSTNDENCISHRKRNIEKEYKAYICCNLIRLVKILKLAKLLIFKEEQERPLIFFL